ncbi:MAG: tetratricopeptide repeat protein [Pseudodesulfovibrio sp.]|uniref:Tetratricopeptide repeat protein n=1 Tax=Pseudodesulfovibrio aespoeensis (strain ATCC 700646 / DSM 10631 / Aspo-2) TaxID=643562 RepID=E6VUV9_PSEA9|nr:MULTISPECIES: tetratricopeptide repeat protein [Pseudodesulfovibrio]MBU4191118.1 tetratricopeptide repeat protein [Pseudomonadota bacterium]ADU63467.1 Tetratricopeptide repeat protein [Pseudodesulfovibrio aespoeensis Aspo-2]MBU4243082.1 tetratricopeptide repeat protein [Pseudomonadota bacterium]MBU4378432.1 tetratricopeptide repeat protein [Pseudomonadota bacterium]MBU4474418.1 tetratricopeptide repeat protein [Pseudomonadota bacterium]
MTAANHDFGRNAVVSLIFVGVAAMFITSFAYRLNNPNLVVMARQPASMNSGNDGSGEGTMPPGMEQMGGNMARIKEYMAQVEANPDDVDALIGLGNSFLMMRAWDRALEPLERANQLSPGNVDVLKGIGIARFSQEDYVKASAAYDEILAVKPDDTLALFNLGVIFKHYFEKPDEARRYFEKVLELEHDDAEMIRLAKQELEK